MNLFPCPCCGFLTLEEKPPGTFLICDVCWWEDDHVQFDNPDLSGRANIFSLIEARENYAQLGISDPALKRYQRAPGLWFRYRLTGAGWAVANIASGQQSCKMMPSYLSDALGDLVETVNLVFETVKATCSWADEPGEWLWSFDREKDNVRIQIRRFRRWGSKGRDPNSETWNRDFQSVMFDATCGLVTFAKEIDHVLRSMLSERTLEQYRVDWRHPFPEAEAKRLRDHIKMR